MADKQGCGQLSELCKCQGLGAPIRSFLEHYKKKKSCYYEDQLKPNELRVTGAGKSHDLSTKAGFMLKEHPAEGVHISAVGNYVSKAVTVVEILKRKSQGLQQSTTIKYARVEDVWEPDMEGLDSMKVVRKIPAISVHLMETADCESATPLETPPPARPSSGKTRSKRRGKPRGGSLSSQDTPVEESGKQAQASACPEVEDVTHLAELKLENQGATKTTTPKGRSVKGRSSSGSGKELQQHERSKHIDGKPP